jgi:Putative beta barrel porin-7 (BBP7)
MSGDAKMIQRMTVALGLLVLVAGSALGQPITDAPRELPPPTREAGPLSEFMLSPSQWSLPAPDNRIWVSGEYLFAFMRGVNLPPLVTTSDAGTPRINAGVLGQPGVSTLFGDQWVNGGMRPGVRLGAGWWCDPERIFGVEAGFMVLAGQGTGFNADSNAFPILARPFVNGLNTVQQSQLVAFPGSSTGTINANASSSNFWEAHIDLVEKARDDGWFRLYSLFGYRYYRYDESVRVHQAISPTGAAFIPGTQIFTNDNFYTGNQFQGLDLGFRSEFVWDQLTLEVLTKLAVGRVTRVININGNQTINTPGLDPIVQQAGFLAGTTNSGLSSSGDWKVLPEAGFALNWQVRPNVNLRLGYTFMLLNGVAQAGGKIDTTINPNFLPGGNTALGGQLRPANNNDRADVWIQSINLGVQWTY